MIVLPRHEEWATIRSVRQALRVTLDLIQGIEMSIDFLKMGGLNVMDTYITHSEEEDIRALAISV